MILLFGSARGVAASIGRGLIAHGVEVRFDGDTDLSVMRDVRAAVQRVRPQAVVMTAGFDDMAACEDDAERAFVDNAENVIHVAAAAREFDAVAVLLSTAEVFGGRGGPWGEGDEPAPLSTWARSRLKGETFMARASPSALIVRTGPILSDEALVEVTLDPATDQWVSPIAGVDVGRALGILIDAKVGGLIHLTTPDEPVTRADLCSALAAARGQSSDKGQSSRQLGRKYTCARNATLLADRVAKYLPSGSLGSWRDHLDAIPPQSGAPPKKETTLGHPQDVTRVDKPWGHEIIWAKTERYVGKVLFVKAGERLSLQYHERKDETVYVMSGKMVFEVGPKDGEREDLIMKAGDSYHITPHTVHRMIAIEDTHILEASTPELDDVVRLEDKYGREGTSAA